MYERLTKFNAETGKYQYKERAKTQEEFNAQRKAVIQRLGEFEDKIEQGKLLELPFGVGDTLYFIDTLDFEPCKKKGKNGDVCPYLVAEYGFGYFCDQTICGCKKIDCAEVKEIKITDIKEIFEYWFDFGETVFLTQEEAEKALERSENGKS